MISLGLKFSNPLEESIRNTLSLGESLRKTVEGIRPSYKPSIRPLEPYVPEIDFSKIEETRTKPFRDISERLDKLIDTTVQTTGFIIEANKTQTEIAHEIKFSGNQTTLYAKKNIRLSHIVIVISSLSLLGFCYSLYRSYNMGKDQRLEIQNYVNTLSNKIADVNNSITLFNKKLVDLLENNNIIMNKVLINENDNLKKQIIEQTKIIDEMRNAIPRQDENLKDR